jgi:hypothetical protein
MAHSQQRIWLDTTFPHSYQIDDELPTDQRVKLYGIHQGPRLFVTPQNGEIFGITIEAPQEDIVLTTWPNPDFFLVRSSGELIDTTAPHNSATLAALEGHSIRYHLLLAEHKLALLGYCGGILCYGETGLKWTIDVKLCGSRPVLDAFRDELIVLTYDKQMERSRRHRFDLTTGEWLGEALFF